jgi:hypothetical protein
MSRAVKWRKSTPFTGGVMLVRTIRILSLAGYVGIVVSAAPVSLRAQAGAPDSTMVTRVRIEDAATGSTVAGRLVQADDRQIVFQPSDSSGNVQVAWANVRKIEVSRGRASFGARAARRAMLGAMFTAPVLGLITTGSAKGDEVNCDAAGSCEEVRASEAFFYGYLLGAWVGAFYGALAAIFPGGERWEEISASPSLAGKAGGEWLTQSGSTYPRRLRNNLKWAGYAGAATGVLYGALASNDCDAAHTLNCYSLTAGDRMVVAIWVGGGVFTFAATLGTIAAKASPGAGRPEQRSTLIVPSLPRGQTGLGLSLSW